jgi:hypothetical protein
MKLCNINKSLDSVIQIEVQRLGVVGLTSAHVRQQHVDITVLPLFLLYLALDLLLVCSGLLLILLKLLLELPHPQLQGCSMFTLVDLALGTIG